MTELGELGAEAVAEEPTIYAFTFHLDFTAADEDQALVYAMRYADVLGVLGTGVDRFGAQVSAQSNWSSAVGVFCNAPGPDVRDSCVGHFGHGGGHGGLGPTDAWADDELVGHE